MNSICKISIIRGINNIYKIVIWMIISLFVICSYGKGECLWWISNDEFGCYLTNYDITSATYTVKNCERGSYIVDTIGDEDMIYYCRNMNDRFVIRDINDNEISVKFETDEAFVYACDSNNVFIIKSNVRNHAYALYKYTIDSNQCILVCDDVMWPWFIIDSSTINVYSPGGDVRSYDITNTKDYLSSKAYDFAIDGFGGKIGNELYVIDYYKIPNECFDYKKSMLAKSLEDYC